MTSTTIQVYKDRRPGSARVVLAPIEEEIIRIVKNKPTPVSRSERFPLEPRDITDEDDIEAIREREYGAKVDVTKALTSQAEKAKLAAADAALYGNEERYLEGAPFAPDAPDPPEPDDEGEPVPAPAPAPEGKVPDKPAPPEEPDAANVVFDKLPEVQQQFATDVVMNAGFGHYLRKGKMVIPIAVGRYNTMNPAEMRQLIYHSAGEHKVRHDADAFPLLYDPGVGWHAINPLTNKVIKASTFKGAALTARDYAKAFEILQKRMK